MSRLRRRDRSGGDRGFTLVEVLTATILLSIVLALVTQALIGAMQHASKLTQEAEAQNRNDTGMQLVTHLLRQAVYPVNGNSTNASVITVATPTKVQFTSRFSGTQSASQTAVDTPVKQYVFQLNGTKLQWGVGDQNACVGTGVCTYATPTANRAIVYGVQNAGKAAACPKNTGDGAVFHYWMVGPTGSLVPWSSSTSTVDKITVVQIDLWTQTQTDRNRPACVPLTDYVQLRNLS